MKLGHNISSEVRRASQMPTTRYWLIGLFGAIVPVIYLRRYAPTPAGAQTTKRPQGRSIWQDLSSSYNKIPTEEANKVIFYAIM